MLLADTSRRREIPLPPRQHRPVAPEHQDEETRRRQMRAQAKGEMIDAVLSVLRGLEGLPTPLSEADRDWLARLVSKPCRAHRGLLEATCPGEDGDPPCHASLRAPRELCDHACPATCPGSMGRLVACEHARVYEEEHCGEWFAAPVSCHVAGCPDCEPQRQARHLRHYQAVCDTEDPRDLILGVFTAENVPYGQLRDGLRRHVRDLAKYRRSPVWTGRGPCLARQSDGGPFHPCTHPEHSWACRHRLSPECSRRRADVSARGAHRRRSRHRRRLCSLFPRRGLPCVHPECRPNCPAFRHRGVAGGLFAIECPPSERTPGTWNLHTNAVIRLRDDDGRRGLRWMALWAELSWYWRRATCRRHRRCPGSPVCPGGAWDLDVRAYDPRKRIGEHLKYVTKTADVLERAGAGPLVEFILARRRVKFLSAFGSFFGVRFVVDPAEQEAADRESGYGPVWVSDSEKRRFFVVCPSCKEPAIWGRTRLVRRVDLRYIAGFLAWRDPPAPERASPISSTTDISVLGADVTSPLDAWLRQRPLVMPEVIESTPYGEELRR